MSKRNPQAQCNGVLQAKKKLCYGGWDRFTLDFLFHRHPERSNVIMSGAKDRIEGAAGTGYSG